MHSDTRSPLGLKIAAFGGLFFLLAPIALIFLYAFSTEEKSFQWPPPGFTTKWIGVTLGRSDVWEAMGLSVKVAAISTLLALILGTLTAAAVARSARRRTMTAIGTALDREDGIAAIEQRLRAEAKKK